jgi:hypothetical protein
VRRSFCFTICAKVVVKMLACGGVSRLLADVDNDDERDSFYMDRCGILVKTKCVLSNHFRCPLAL